MWKYVIWKDIYFRMPVTPNQIQGTESGDVCMAPVSVVLERTDYEVLSTAEVCNLCINCFLMLYLSTWSG